jgi:hypothetical protein
MSCTAPTLTLDLLAFDFLEGRERKRVEEHAEICPDCRAALEACRADRAMVTRVLAADSRPFVRPSRLPWFAAAAAVLLLAAGLLLVDTSPEVPPTGIAERGMESGECPERFTAALRRTWPDAAAADIAAAETAAWRAVDRYLKRVRRAKSEAEKDAAEAELTDALTRRVAQMILVYGTPETVEDEATGPGEEEKDQVLVVTGRPDVVLRGTPEEVAAQVAAMISDRIGAPVEEALVVGERWVAAYRIVLDQTPADVIADFENGLGGEPSADPAVEHLREGLLEVQRRVEAAMPGATSAPTFFILFGVDHGAPGSEPGELDAMDRTPSRVDQEDAGDVEQDGVLEKLTAGRSVLDRR